MRLDIGAHVKASDGQDVGAIKHLIVARDGFAVRAVVIERGLLPPDDIEVPLRMLALTEGPDIQVGMTAEQVNDLPRFNRAVYTVPPTGGTETPLGTPAGGVLWPVATPQPTMAAGSPTYALPLMGVNEGVDYPEGERTEDEEELTRENAQAVLDGGSEIRTSDNEKIGELGGVIIDLTNGRIDHLIMRRGFLSSREATLPGAMIASVDIGAINLSASRSEVRQTIEQAA